MDLDYGDATIYNGCELMISSLVFNFCSGN